MNLPELQPYLPVIISTIISILTLIVSVYTAKYYGERGVEIAKRRRDHSVILNDVVLKFWLSNLSFCSGLSKGEYEMIEGVETKRGGEFMPRIPCDPEVEFFEYLKQHLETGYPNVIKDWQGLKRDVLSFNEQRVGFLKRLHIQITKEMKASAGKEPKYWSYETPLRFVHPEFAQWVYIALERFTTTRKKEVKRLHEVRDNARRIYELECEGFKIYKSNRARDLKKAQMLFSKLISSQGNIKEVEKLVKRHSELEERHHAFERTLRELKNFIELGNTLKGECQYCPQHV